MYDNFLKIVLQKLKYFRYSKNTIDIYYHYIEKFLKHTNKYPKHLVGSDFQNYLDVFSFSSTSQQNQIINAIKFLYEKILDKKYNKVKFDRPKKERKLPTVIDEIYLKNCLDNIYNLKHKAILSLAYSVALRVSDVINMKIKDIDSKRMQIRIVEGKGKKDAYLPLTQNILNLLRLYFKEFKPKEYLFNGQNNQPQYSAGSCNKLVKKYIGKEHHFHELRHSQLTHLMDKGVNQRLIQKLARHSSSKTTEIYTHVSKSTLEKLPLY